MQHPKVIQLREICKRPVALRITCLVMILGFLRLLSGQVLPHERERLSSSALSMLTVSGRRGLEARLSDIDNSALGVCTADLVQ